MDKYCTVFIDLACISVVAVRRKRRALSESDRGALLSVLPPEAEEIFRAAEQLIGSSRELTLAADRLSTMKNCSMDGELVSLGAALQKVGEALKWLEPMLLEKERVNIVELTKPGPTTGKALAENWRRSQSYLSAAGKIAEAGGKLTGLDPIGSAGPPAEVGRMIQEAALSLLALNEKSAIGVPIKVAAEAMDRFREGMEQLRLATKGFDKAACANAARQMGKMLALAGETLRGSVSNLWQWASALSLGLALSQVPNEMPTASLERVAFSVDLYAKSLLDKVEVSVEVGVHGQRPGAPAKCHQRKSVFRQCGSVAVDRRRILTH